MGKGAKSREEMRKGKERHLLTSYHVLALQTHPFNSPEAISNGQESRGGSQPRKEGMEAK